jgi:Spy/CpxP family protein refolding chaperone
MKTFALVVFLVFTLAASSLAASPQKQAAYNIPDAQGYNVHFGDMDPNKDGKVSWQEFKRFFQKRMKKCSLPSI